MYLVGVGKRAQLRVSEGTCEMCDFILWYHLASYRHMLRIRSGHLRMSALCYELEWTVRRNQH